MTLNLIQTQVLHQEHQTCVVATRKQSTMGTLQQSAVTSTTADKTSLHLPQRLDAVAGGGCAPGATTLHRAAASGVFASGAGAGDAECAEACSRFVRSSRRPPWRSRRRLVNSQGFASTEPGTIHVQCASTRVITSVPLDRLCSGHLLCVVRCLASPTRSHVNQLVQYMYVVRAAARCSPAFSSPAR